MNPITVRDNTYSSVAAAWRARSPTGLKLITVRWRLRNGWTNWSAITTPVVPPELRRRFNEVRAMHWQEASEM